MTDTLNGHDTAWLQSLREEIAERSVSTLQRDYLLQQLFERMQVDYLYWGYGVQDPHSLVNLTAEFYDYTSDYAVRFEDLDGQEKATEYDNKRKSYYARYAYVAHTLNNSKPSSRFIADLSRATSERQVTVEQSRLNQIMSFRTKLSMLSRPDLLYKKRSAGLDDFMFTLRRISNNASGGIGYHRAFQKDAAGNRAAPAARFTPYDRLLAHTFSETFRHILYAVRIDLGALEMMCRSGVLNYWERVAFPLLVSDRFSDKDIAIIIGVKPSRPQALAKSVCGKIEHLLQGGVRLRGTTRADLRYALFYASPPDPHWEAGSSDNHVALNELDVSPMDWDPGFAGNYEEPKLRERNRGKRRKR